MFCTIFASAPDAKATDAAVWIYTSPGSGYGQGRYATIRQIEQV